MALDATQFHEDKAFVKPSPRLFPVRIQHQHYQLRHYISTTEEGLVYYAANHDIFALYTTSGRRERIASLEFKPYCFVAGHGWICAGAENGRCVFIDIQDRSAEVDSLLPLNLDPSTRLNSEDAAESAFAQRSRAIRAKIHPRIFGKDIINSITLHRMKCEEKGISDEDVAVISTNESAIHIFSLQQMQTLKVLDFPVNMNHASISPNGELMVACGDDKYAFFCRRKRLPSLAVVGETTYIAYDWEEFAQVQLPSPVRRDNCFSTAFSPSGHVCSVSSQNGIVTVYDTSLIREDMEDNDAVIDTFTSSRPAAIPDDMATWMPGAIRSSAFSPGPWDFFAWAEDRGRICIADMRDGFRTRQMLELDPSSSELRRCEISELDDNSIAEVRELDLEASFLRRHRDALRQQDHYSAMQNSADMVESSADRRRRQRETGLISNTWNSAAADLTDHEREILDSFAADRSQESSLAAEAEMRHPFSVSYGSHNGAGSSTPYNPQIFPRQYTRERSNTLNRESIGSSRALPPRRRSSIVMSSSNRHAGESQPSSSSHPSSLLPITGGSTLSTSPSRLGTTTSANASSSQTSARSSTQSSPTARDSGTEAWRTISAALSRAAEAEAPPSVVEASRRSRLRELSRHERLLAEEQQAVERRRSRQRELEEARAQVIALANAVGTAVTSAGSVANAGNTATGTPATGPAAPGPFALGGAAAAISAEAAPGSTTNRGLAPEPSRAAEPDRSSSAADPTAPRLTSASRRTTTTTTTTTMNNREDDYSSQQRHRDAARRQQFELLLAGNRAALNRQDALLGRAERDLDAVVRTQQLRRLQERAQLAEDRLNASTLGGGGGAGGGGGVLGSGVVGSSVLGSGGAGSGGGGIGSRDVAAGYGASVGASTGWGAGVRDPNVAGSLGAASGLDLMRDAEGFVGLGFAGRREREEREYGVSVTGLGWSRDGRRLFVGTEDGIFEFELNLARRKCWPSITPR